MAKDEKTPQEYLDESREALEKVYGPEEPQPGSRTFTLTMVPEAPRPYPGDKYFMGREDGFSLSLVFPTVEWKALGEPETLEVRISLP